MHTNATSLSVYARMYTSVCCVCIVLCWFQRLSFCSVSFSSIASHGQFLPGARAYVLHYNGVSLSTTTHPHGAQTHTHTFKHREPCTQALHIVYIQTKGHAEAKPTRHRDPKKLAECTTHAQTVSCCFFSF